MTQASRIWRPCFCKPIIRGPLYKEVAPARAGVVSEIPVRLMGKDDSLTDCIAYASYFREGILIIIAPQEGDSNELLRLLGRRDMVIRTLLSKRLPVLTDMAVLVADLQESVKICSELPPDEYFELVNKIWSTAGDIFRKYYGTYGKHVGDGMVYYFFPQPDSNYVMNAVICAQELKTAMARLSKEWQLRKNWGNELYLNIGLNEGQEWLGTLPLLTTGVMRLTPSRILMSWLAVVTLGAGILLACYLPVGWALIPGVAVVASAMTAWRLHARRSHPQAVVALRIEGRLLSCQTGGGDWVDTQRLPGGFVSFGLTIIRLQAGTKRCYVVILPDCIAEADFRQLRVWLGWAREVGAAGDVP